MFTIGHVIFAFLGAVGYEIMRNKKEVTPDNPQKHPDNPENSIKLKKRVDTEKQPTKIPTAKETILKETEDDTKSNNDD